MALNKELARLLFTTTTNSPAAHSSYSSLFQTLLSKNSTLPNASKGEFRREFFTSSGNGFLHRFLHRHAINNNSGDHRLTINWMMNPLPPPPAKPREETGEFIVRIKDAKKMLGFVQLEKVKQRLRTIPASTIPYGEFARICGDVCNDREHGVEIFKALENSGDVIIVGAVVFLRPDEVAKSMEKLILQSIGMPNDPRREELAQLEMQKSVIDQKAQSLVQRELYFGLGFLILQTLGFMRLTFWELSWDVMEPICFFVTSAHFAFAYAFFLRTSKEPSFNGYFQSRFEVKQKKLMQVHNFDIERYNKLCEAFCCKPTII